MFSISLDGADWGLQNGRSGERYRASVPGFVQKDLMEAGLLPDLYDTLLESKIEWVEHDDWTYSRRFRIDEETLGSEALELVMEGVDTYAEVELNGIAIGRTDNMFLTYRFDIKAAAQADNELVVRIKSPTATLLGKEREFGDKLTLWNGIPARLFGRKAQYGYGWDWGARLVTVGIHKAVRVEGYASIRAFQPAYEISHLSDELALLNVSVAVDSRLAASTAANFTFRLYDRGQLCAQTQQPLTLKSGEHRYCAGLSVERPKRWYPIGHGDPHLYRLEVVVEAGGASVSAECPAGLREVNIAMPYDEQGRKFIIEVNGIPVLCKGVNWIPLTLFPGLDTAEDYRREIEAIADANMNMIRIWGGGNYENHDFFDLCDRMGVLVWQDFMFACGDYPDDEAFCELVRREADFIVAEYGAHPSIALWCGNNENQVFVERSREKRKQGYGEKLYFEVLDDACAKDKLRPYWPSSPYCLTFNSTKLEGDYGDQHYWGVWGGVVPYEQYSSVNGRFLSEFGMQSYPSMRIMDKVDAASSLRGKRFDAMQKSPNGIQRLLYYTSGDYLMPTAKSGFVYVNQLMQANALRLGVEHWVTRMPDTSGALVWQWSDLWPSISWSIVDYDKVRKPSYYYMKRSFQSPGALLKRPPGAAESELYLVHDRGDFQGRAVVEVYDIATEAVVDAAEFAAEGKGHRSTRIGGFKTDVLDPSRHVLFVSLYDGSGSRLARSSYLVGKPHELVLRPARLVVKESRGEDGELRYSLSSDVFAKDVCLPNVPGTMSDNYFDLRAGETVEIVVHGPMPADFLASPMCLNNIGTIDYV